MKLEITNNHIYEKNVESLSSKYPNLFTRINTYKEKKANYQIINSKDGNKSLMLINGGRKVFINSKYKPIEEAKKWIDSIEFRYDTIVIVFGFGIGYRIKELAAILPDNNKLIVFEPSVDIFVDCINYIDVSDVIEKENVYLAIGKDIEEYKHILNESINWINYDDILMKSIPNYEKLFIKEYNSLLSSLEETRIRKVSDKNTVMYFNRIWQKNLIMNMPHMISCNYVKDLFEIFKDKPAIIVSAGPSLNKNVKLLKRAKDNMLIICVGTALRVLLKENIRPDIVITIDGGEANYNHFRDINYDDITLVYAPRTHPEILNKHKGNKILSVSFDNYIINLFKEFGKDIGFIKSGGSVSNSAMDLAVRMGANPIVFVGQDLAYIDNRSYAEGTIYDKHVIDNIQNKEDSKSIERESNKIYVDDINGEPILTSPEWYKFLRWFENEIEKDTSDRLYIDATEGGARIKGTSLMTLREVIERFGTKNKSIYAKIDSAIKIQPQFSIDEISSILKQYKFITKELMKIQEACVKAENLGVQLCNTYEKKDIVDIASTSLILKELNKINTLILSRKEVFECLEFMLEPILVNLSKILEEEKNYGLEEANLLQRKLMFYIELKNAIIYIEPFLKTCIENLKKMI